MALQDVRPLQEGLPFGARIGGITRELLQDLAVRQEINDIFAKEGMIIFEGVEPSNDMQVALSNVFGPLKDHPVAAVTRVDGKTMPGLVEIAHRADEPGIFEIGGKSVSHWLPWHFDHCYNGELNRAGVLRAVQISQDGGLTGFVDGVALYNAFPKDLRSRIEGKTIAYTLNVLMKEMRFGVPEGFRVISENSTAQDMTDKARSLPRSLHPAVWTLPDGRKTLHISPWMAAGIVGMENPEGDALLDEVCQTIYRIAKSQSYFHKWKPTDMLIWDNCRTLHMVTGHPPEQNRIMQRTTIKGDYGLGGFENNGVGNKILEVVF